MENDYCPQLANLSLLESSIECQQLIELVWMKIGWTTEGLMYLEAVRDALNYEDFFKVFKRDTRYNQILEHVSPEEGLLYYIEISKKTPYYYHDYQLIQKIIDNQYLGSCNIFSEVFDVGTNKKMFIPSTNLRYLKIVSDIEYYFDLFKTDSVNLSIAEIGVGYGGQAQAFHARISSLNSSNISIHYTMYDLPEVQQLAIKYLSNFHWIDLNTFALINISSEVFLTDNIYPGYLHNNNTDYSLDKKIHDLCISNYAISELSSLWQIWYLFNVLRYCRRGYVTYNDIGLKLHGTERWYDVLSFSELLNKLLNNYYNIVINISILPEKPLTDDGNSLLVWS
eukprot:gene14861-19977_t